MKKTTEFLTVLLTGACILSPVLSFAAGRSPVEKKAPVEQTTRGDAVIFKVHEIEPVLEDGIVTGCDYTVTLYNRTSINFRNFTVNLNWKDPVEERFQFERYVEGVVGKEEALKHKEFLSKNESTKPMKSEITVNAFGANKQISIKSHIQNEKCYLLLTDAEYTVTPCDIARSIDSASTLGGSIDNKNCTGLFQYVSASNPEYFGQFKDVSASDLALQQQQYETRELTDIDSIIGKIVENLGVSDKTLTDIN